MNFTKQWSKAVFALAVLSTPLMGQAGGGPGGGSGSGGPGGGGNGGIIAYVNTLPLEAIDANEHEDLIFSRQEEKLARDVYLMLYQAWGIQSFNNIAQGEQAHMDLTLFMLDRYGIVDPLTSDAVGVYADPALTTLFRRLVTYGLQSPTRALVVGAIVEDLDLFDLDSALQRSDNRDLDTLWQNLARGSRNHMRAFYGSLENQGVYFTGIKLPTWYILQIVNSPSETGAVDENGDVLP